MSFGSQRWYPYTDDGGNVWGVKGDESNIEMVNTGADALTVPAGIRRLPADIKRREIKLLAADQTTKIIPILTSTRFIEIDTNEAFSSPAEGDENATGTSFVVVQKIPERILRAPFALDTGKIDGDQP
jgi:hypothetical protein